jgi:hypothetical protein
VLKVRDMRGFYIKSINEESYTTASVKNDHLLSSATAALQDQKVSLKIHLRRILCLETINPAP